jgi:hypothetical protein
LPGSFALRLQVVNLLEKELVEMRQKFLELQSCRMEFQNIQRRYENLLQSAPDAMISVNSQARSYAYTLS